MPGPPARKYLSPVQVADAEALRNDQRRELLPDSRPARGHRRIRLRIGVTRRHPSTSITSTAPDTSFIKRHALLFVQLFATQTNPNHPKSANCFSNSRHFRYAHIYTHFRWRWLNMARSRSRSKGRAKNDSLDWPKIDQLAGNYQANRSFRP